MHECKHYFEKTLMIIRNLCLSETSLIKEKSLLVKNFLKEKSLLVENFLGLGKIFACGKLS